MNRMLINATQQEELRIAVVKDSTLYDLDIEVTKSKHKKSNVYKGVITRVEPSLGAAFVDYGTERHGFLPFKEVALDLFVPSENKEDTVDTKSLAITDVLKEGQELMVQVSKEERGQKGAALTTYISLAGSYLVLMPNNPRAGGISRRVDGKERDDLRTVMGQLNIPENFGVIVRTAGVGKTAEELQWDLDALLHHWEAIQQASNEKPAPFLIHQEGDAIIRALRDHLRQDVIEILVDVPEVYEKIQEYIKQVRPDFCDRVKLYQDKTPLFSHYQVEKQIETAYQRKVTLPSGGSIVIDPTEALVSIDVNSAKATSGKNIEETALNINLEAADEIARQLRLRDIGGLVVIDFIDMTITQNQREVANRLKEDLRADRARVHIGNITRFGLMEMSRQRIRSRLGEEIQVTCPRCDGQGTVRSTSSLALSIVRLLEEEATKDKTVQLQAHLPVDLATYMLNEKREAINKIEQRQGVRILIIPNQYIKPPKFRIKRLRANELPRGRRHIPSYKLMEIPKMDSPDFGEDLLDLKKPEVPAVKAMIPKEPSPVVKKKKQGFLAKIVKRIFGKEPKKPVKTTSRGASRPRTNTRYSQGNRKPQSNHYSRGRPRSSSYNTRNTRGGNRPPQQRQSPTRTRNK